MVLAGISAVCLAKGSSPYDSLYTDLPVKMQRVTLPSIPARTVSLTDFGAKGDGITLCTEAFRQGIEALSQQGGGHLIVPAGVWLTGPIVLQSNIDLHLEANALVVFSPDKALFNPGQKGRYLPLISGEKLHDVSITGRGTFDGNGKYWRPVKHVKMSKTEWDQFRRLGGYIDEEADLWFPFNLKHFGNQVEHKDVNKAARKEESIRNDLVRIIYSENLLFQGVTFLNSPRFHLHPIVCKNVIVDGVTVHCPWNAQNGDGIDLANVQTGLVVNCTVDVGDDGICMKGGVGADGEKRGACQDILFQNNVIRHAHGGFVIGSDVSGGMKRLVFRRNTLTGTDVGLRFKSGLGRGGSTSGIFCQDLVMNEIKGEAILFDCTYQDKPAGQDAKVTPLPAQQPDASTGASAQSVVRDYAPDFHDINIQRLTCRECGCAIRSRSIAGRKCVYDIKVSNSQFFYTEQAEDIDADSHIETQNVTYATY